uniref:Uncharacterized protein n=1 Tax=Physcomitrium patens TaxID=3218 RepID=A0A2K1KGG9_PHYPA|nr:hypothetical protein PHYPA_009247 [Physcomitrium patens]
MRKVEVNQFTDDDAMLNHLKMCISFSRSNELEKSAPRHKAAPAASLETSTEALSNLKLEEHDIDSALAGITDKLQALQATAN